MLHGFNIDRRTPDTPGLDQIRAVCLCGWSSDWYTVTNNEPDDLAPHNHLPDEDGNPTGPIANWRNHQRLVILGTDLAQLHDRIERLERAERQPPPSAHK